MKKLIILSSLLLFFIACNTATEQTGSTFDKQKETDAIMNVIKKETECFFSGDYNCWADTWVQEDYAMQAWNNEEGSYDAVVGWDNIQRQGRYWIKEYYGDGSNVQYPYVKREDPMVKFFGDSTAYLVWKQYNADDDKEVFQISQESRLMQKQKDGWKIVNVTAFWDTNNSIPIDEVDIE